MTNMIILYIKIWHADKFKKIFTSKLVKYFNYLKHKKKNEYSYVLRYFQPPRSRTSFLLRINKKPDKMQNYPFKWIGKLLQ